MGYPARKNWKTSRGDTRTVFLTWKPGGTAANLATWSARMQVRTTGGTLLTGGSLTTANGLIALANGANNITLTFNATLTGNAAGKYAYGLVLTNPDGEDTTLLEGGFELAARVVQ